MSEPIECGTYSAPQAAKRLGCCRDTVKHMVDTGRLPKVDTGTNRIYIPKWAVDRLVAPPETVVVEIPNQALVDAAMSTALRGSHPTDVAPEPRPVSPTGALDRTPTRSGSGATPS